MSGSALERYRVADDYPTRMAGPGAFYPRKDPVLYNAVSEHAPLTVQQQLCYQNKGYVVLDRLFDPAEVAALRHRSSCLRERLQSDDRPELITEPHTGAVRSVFNLDRFSSDFSALMRDRRLLSVARWLLDDAVYIHQSRLNYRPGFRGEPFYWHSDFETWHAEDGMPRMRALSMSIALTDNDPINGALLVVPGSHQHFVGCQGQTPENNFQQSLKQQVVGVPTEAQVERLVSQGGIEAVSMKAGSVLIFDCNTLHGSNSNITPAARSNIFLVYNAVSNSLQAPFCGRPERPEFLAHRKAVAPL